MKKLVCFIVLGAIFLVTASSWTYVQMTPERLKAIFPPLERKIYPAPTQPLPASYGQKVLIVLQENTGRLVYLPDGTPAEVQALVNAVVDRLAETFENLKSTLQANGKYNKVVLLTDVNCTRAKLLENLVFYTKQGMTIDLLILGHGSPNALTIYGRQYLTGQTSTNLGNIRTLLTDARAQGCQKLNLRLVYMCNCDGSTTNDDWIAIGALHSIGPKGLNYMPEPQITFFMNNWVGGQTPGTAATNAYNGSIPFFQLIFPPQPVVRWEKKPVTYPCGVTWDPNCVVAGVRTGCPKTVYCTTYMDVAVVTFQTDPKIVSSQPVPVMNSVIAGQQWTFNTVIR